jgi:hypothetical protein
MTFAMELPYHCRDCDEQESNNNVAYEVVKDGQVKYKSEADQKELDDKSNWNIGTREFQHGCDCDCVKDRKTRRHNVQKRLERGCAIIILHKRLMEIFIL